MCSIKAHNQKFGPFDSIDEAGANLIKQGFVPQPLLGGVPSERYFFHPSLRIYAEVVLCEPAPRPFEQLFHHLGVASASVAA